MKSHSVLYAHVALKRSKQHVSLLEALSIHNRSRKLFGARVLDDVSWCVICDVNTAWVAWWALGISFTRYESSRSRLGATERLVYRVNRQIVHLIYSRGYSTSTQGTLWMQARALEGKNTLVEKEITNRELILTETWQCAWGYTDVCEDVGWKH